MGATPAAHPHAHSSPPHAHTAPLPIAPEFVRPAPPPELDARLPAVRSLRIESDRSRSRTCTDAWSLAEMMRLVAELEQTNRHQQIWTMQMRRQRAADRGGGG
jgi:hypothetical protein